MTQLLVPKYPCLEKKLSNEAVSRNTHILQESPLITGADPAIEKKRGGLDIYFNYIIFFRMIIADNVSMYPKSLLSLNAAEYKVCLEFCITLKE